VEPADLAHPRAPRERIASATARSFRIRELRQAADPSVGILNWFPNRKPILGSSDKDSSPNRDPQFGIPNWDPAGGIPDRDPPMGASSPEQSESIARADKLQVVPRGLETNTLRL
jgi:hypothetical protein